MVRDRTSPRQARALLSAVVTRISVDVPRSARVWWEKHVGQWLPERLFSDPYQDPERPAELANPMSMAVLLPTLMAQDRAADESARRTTHASYMALGWVVLFFAFHVPWYLGGSFASPGAPHSLVAWIFEVLVAGAFPLGAFVCLVIARGWTRGQLPLPPAPSSGSAACCCSCAAAPESSTI
jgi:hypothetical protein